MPNSNRAARVMTKDQLIRALSQHMAEGDTLTSITHIDFVSNTEDGCSFVLTAAPEHKTWAPLSNSVAQKRVKNN